MKTLDQLNRRLLRTSRWVDKVKPQAKRFDPQRGWETDSVLYVQLCMLQNNIGRLLIQIDRLEDQKRKYNYK